MLIDLNLPHVINTSKSDLINDFFLPTLSNATTYSRGVGYFSSGWLRVNAKGMTQFAANDGRARWITSPILNSKDWEALQLGQAARENPYLSFVLKRNIDDLAKTLERDTLSALAWMVADGILDFRLALPYNKLAGGDFHDKFGIFSDPRGNQIAFNGSYNESVQGLRNYESIHIFKSWESALQQYIESISSRFELLWANKDPNVLVLELPDAAREQILQLREEQRPYPKPERLKHYPSASTYREPTPFIPDNIQLRDYQDDAISAWFANNCQGLFEMATGTGKTITALAASSKLFAREKRLVVIIAVPYQHLVDQWADESAVFGYQALLAYESKTTWLDKLNQQILEYNAEYRRFVAVVTTHATFSSEDFQTTIDRITGPALVIADEAHHLGAEQRRKYYPEQISYRLALSATPDRWFDDIGTAALRAYFGQTVFSFTLEQAIGVSLTEYYYFPHLVELTDDELDEYQDLTIKIARIYNKEDENSQEILKSLLRKRANLLNVAQNKLTTLSNLIDKQSYVEHALFYCAPGQITDVIRLLGAEKGILVHSFTAEEPNSERQTLLDDFSKGELQGLVAMKCLDEGVDVPNTRTAFFLASSGNPREFIQRRGRILRRALGKKHATVHDLIAIPPVVTKDSSTYKAERSIVRRELQRFKEFANPARNKHEALNVIWELATHYGLRDF